MHTCSALHGIKGNRQHRKHQVYCEMTGCRRHPGPGARAGRGAGVSRAEPYMYRIQMYSTTGLACGSMCQCRVSLTWHPPPPHDSTRTCPCTACFGTLGGELPACMECGLKRQARRPAPTPTPAPHATPPLPSPHAHTTIPQCLQARNHAPLHLQRRHHGTALSFLKADIRKHAHTHTNSHAHNNTRTNNPREPCISCQSRRVRAEEQSSAAWRWWPGQAAGRPATRARLLRR